MTLRVPARGGYVILLDNRISVVVAIQEPAPGPPLEAG